MSTTTVVTASVSTSRWGERGIHNENTLLATLSSLLLLLEMGTDSLHHGGIFGLLEFSCSSALEFIVGNVSDMNVRLDELAALLFHELFVSHRSVHFLWLSGGLFSALLLFLVLGNGGGLINRLVFVLALGFLNSITSPAVLAVTVVGVTNTVGTRAAIKLTSLRGVAISIVAGATITVVAGTSS